MSIEAGFYQGRVVPGSGAFGETKKGDVEALFQVLLDTGDYVHVRLNFSEKAQKYSVDKLRALGWKGGDLTFERCPNEVTIQIKYETYEGEERMKADIVTQGVKPLTPDKARAFQAKMVGLLGGSLGGGADDVPDFG